MAVHTDSRQKNGVLTIDGEQFACQQRNVRVMPPGQSDDAVPEVLDGTPLSEDESAQAAWKLGFRSIQDFTNPEGLQKYSWDHSGEVVPCTWQPAGPTGPTYAGMIQVYALEVGGDVATRLEVEAEWKWQAMPTWTPAT